jgi:proteasome lid subunit RPN8/RPN11
MVSEDELAETLEKTKQALEQQGVIFDVNLVFNKIYDAISRGLTKGVLVGKQQGKYLQVLDIAFSKSELSSFIKHGYQEVGEFIYGISEPPINVTHMVLPRQVLEQLEFEALEAKKRGLYEFIGVMYGEVKDGVVHINYIERLPDEVTGLTRESLTLGKKFAGKPVGGELATQRMDQYVAAHPGIVGFYHTHPHMGTIPSGADKKDIIDAANLPNLKRPSAIHLITGLKGTGFLKKVAMPAAYFRTPNSKIERIEVQIV